MMLLNDIKPDMSIYYYGSLIIKEVESKENHNIVSLYNNVKRKYHISLKMYSYCLDWLFLIEAVIIDESGEVSLCT
ncbi:hypothetical protein MXE81_03020 [Mammaliicoccus sciuri]|uniref:ABC-three component system middle component 6 n=1 Tax=Mammaliicoccus sciuri TaxID=1296 RepID=UPI001E4C572B|nr:ABC-three component system middle component 6 [Mammaliicoccus sciuri]MCD8777378.1 hypothetical protein [Mammaliicoccus sciuri]MCD8780764.1 hypothetical protein [Mammaliicoccus sciuri]MEB6057297.1 hypothetical protein [Mammaliicoccus sciuri]